LALATSLVSALVYVYFHLEGSDSLAAAEGSEVSLRTGDDRGGRRGCPAGGSGPSAALRAGILRQSTTPAARAPGMSQRNTLHRHCSQC